MALDLQPLGPEAMTMHNKTHKPTPRRIETIAVRTLASLDDEDLRAVSGGAGKPDPTAPDLGTITKKAC
jgi:hypothetical protein